MSQNNETAAMLVSQTSPVGVELFSYANAFFCSDKFCIDAGHVSENTLLGGNLCQINWHHFMMLVLTLSE